MTYHPFRFSNQFNAQLLVPRNDGVSLLRHQLLNFDHLLIFDQQTLSSPQPDLDTPQDNTQADLPGAWLRPVSRGNRHFTVGGGRLRQSGPRPEGKLLRQPTLEGLKRSARMDSPRKTDRSKSDQSTAGGGAAAQGGGRRRRA
ncbi:hypothetical protein F511_31130 [Dorcoceras hygrometricum]|uniref:Uncharacterized protein n=1 Tax=Dorcoceras hygrometricum TaxID=472368 RepID=A0A2Z7CME9_9LAMI|nr:hypothetical protein F511_31130 [Dorcoceras hygrometricum]